ncbi:universal stress protein [Varunaivibrio sulfuroxidans]|uniref:Universal stress protein family protein n=1 Tax=Varunaivibrio sulfuroxidans TaxID=1773489 RepID=A0A4R3J937_9PROT|nr:universal stress protein [Varunaivibrio sulfuroxidans]TCS62459.1 universal stress protein family protein [Varunaivibrio sulfuroxidans]WES30865.1 universal stress protein [Varunaivibrio sulfuroxidans]
MMSQVIACIDGTNVSTAVCDYAAWASLRLDAPLQFLHVLEKALYPAASDLSGNIGLGSRETLLHELAALDEKRGKIALEQGKNMLKAARERAIADGVPAPTSRQRHGSLLETLADIADDIRLLVLGKHDEHLGDHIGSRLENVVRTQHRPTLITPAVFKTPRRVMLAFDRSSATRKGIETVAASPLLRGLPCHVVMVGDDNAANREHLDWARATLQAAGFDTPTALIPGEVEQTLCDYRARHDIDMLIMGAYGHSVVRRFFVGSTTTAVIRDAQVPVLLLR